MAEAFAIKLPPLQWLRWLLHQYGWKKESWLHIFILYCLQRFSFLSTPSWSDTFRQSATRCALSFKLDVARWVCLLPRWRCATPFLQPLWPELMAHGGRRAGRRFSTGFNDNTSCRIDLRHPPEQQLGPCANPLNNGNVHWNNEPSSYWMVIFSHWWFLGGDLLGIISLGITGVGNHPLNPRHWGARCLMRTSRLLWILRGFGLKARDVRLFRCMYMYI